MTGQAIKTFITGLLWLFLIAGVPVAKAEPGFRVFSMNLHCFEERWQERLNTILTTVMSEEIDVYAFQEVCIGEGEDQAAFLTKRLQELQPDKLTVKSLFTHRAWDRYGEYVLVIARGDKLQVRAGLLPESPLQRGYVSIRVGDVWFINTHLEYHEDNTVYRLKQLEFLVKEFAGQQHILMGDFNSSPVMEEQRPLSRAGYNAHFPGPTFPANQPELKIDGFWISPLLKDRVANVFVKRLFGPGLPGGVQSDHLGVLLEVDFAR